MSANTARTSAYATMLASRLGLTTDSVLRIPTPRRHRLFHRLQENIFQRIAPGVQTPELDLALGGEAVDVADVDPLRQHHLHAPVAHESAFAAELFQRRREGR